MDKEIREYVLTDKFRSGMGLPDQPVEEYKILAQGEYNKNYYFVHPLNGRELVLRINYGSQMHLAHQIEYEANALRLLEESGRTAHVCYVDGSPEAPGGGVLVMDYIPGRALDYNSDEELKGAAECLADIHSVKIQENETLPAEPDAFPPNADKLIAPGAAMKAILNECEDMLNVYIDSNLPAADKKRRLRRLLDAAWKVAGHEQTSAHFCCINTELNSTNFLVDDSKGSIPKISLVDWEKPLYGDPAQDLAHFLAPTTTFWKTDVIFDDRTVQYFMNSYINAVSDRFDVSGIRERTNLLIPITCLRGMSWCAMAWVQYRGAEKELVNETTMMKLDDYLSDRFLITIEKIVNV